MPEGVEEGTKEQPAPGLSAIRSGKVFVSYASQDSAVANAIVESLERACIPCWIAPRNVVAGEFYADAIVHAIDAARVLVLVLSQSSAASHHILREVERASSKRHPVIALRIDRASLPAGLEYFLNTSQWLDAADADPVRTLPKLIEAVRKALAGAAAGLVDTSAKPTSSEPTPRRNRVIVVVAALLIVILVSLEIDKIWSSRHADSAHRAPTTGVVAQTLAGPPTVTAAFAPPPHSIAVLPFVNMSGDPKQEYFSDGLTEELLNSLSRLNELQVVAKTSSFSFKGQNVDIATIAHKLNVGAVLEGSVRRDGGTVRITVQLIDAVSGFHMWSETYDRKLKDILRLQTELATSVSQQLETHLVGDEVSEIELGGTKSAAAYEAYLRGTQRLLHWDTGEAGLRTVLTDFDQALALDPSYAAAHAQRARALDYFAIFVAEPSNRAGVRKQAREAAERAVALAPTFGEAHLELAQVLAYGTLDFRSALPEFDLALSLAPGSARVQSTFAGFASNLDHFDPARLAAQRAISLDPQNSQTHTILGHVFFDAHRYSEALDAFRDALALDRSSHYVEALRVLALVASGQTIKAGQECQSPESPLDDDARHQCLSLAYHALGRQMDAERELAQYQALSGDRDAYAYAGIYAQWGNVATALSWLRKAEQLRDPGFQSLKVNWQLDPIRNEPEFKAILARMNFPP
jgi:TolB-like protein/tetratricopeptide (TPR) repeat protein